MIKFRQKIYTIPEGHYTGPKDMEQIPGTVELVSKGAISGAGVGAVVNAVLNKGSLDSAKSGAVTGMKYGAASGLLAKLLLNYMHKPMTSLKYQEVDQAIRRQFGVFRISGITVGDSIDKRDKIEEKFSFNDRNVSEYKINIAICDNKFTLYTFGMTNQELDQTSSILDYYCKKYYGMEYDAKVINARVNSYSVAIAFTNGMAVGDFIMELSDKLKTKINLLDSKAIILPRLESAAKDSEGEPEETTFSVTDLTTFDLLRMIMKGGLIMGTAKKVFKSSEFAYAAIPALIDASSTLSSIEKQRAGIPVSLGELNNVYLEKTLKNLHYIEPMDYTTYGSSNAGGLVNMSVGNGLLFITVGKKSNDYNELEDNFYKPLQGTIKRSEGNGVVCYIYTIKSDRDFKDVLNKLMSCKIKPNIFNETVTDTWNSTKGKFLGTLKKVF